MPTEQLKTVRDEVLQRAERLRPKLSAFAPAAWGDPRLDPYFPVSASITLADIVIPAIRFVCRPEETAFTGTEKV